MKALKTLLIWLLPASIPLQGLAAKAMVVCESSHQRMAQASVTDHLQSLHTQHRHGGHHAYQRDVADAGMPPNDDIKAGASAVPECSASAQCGALSWDTVAGLTLPGMACASGSISYAAVHIPRVDPA